MRMQIPNYSLFLLTGMFPWVWFSNSLIQATGSFRNNASLVKKVKVQRAVLPLSNVIHEMIHFCFSIPIIVLFILIGGGNFYLSWLWQFPLMIFLQLMLLYPVALFFAIANVYVHDVEYIVGIGMSLMFFLTPIVYPLSMVPEKYRLFFEMNPIAIVIQNWRAVFLNGDLDYTSFFYGVVIAIILFLFSLLIYRKSSRKIGELL